MNLPILFLGVICSLAQPVLAMAAEPAATKVVTNASVAAAARRSTLKDIDYGSTYCDGATTVAEWLKALTGPDARGITWTGGKCRLTNDLNPLDLGGRWCAQATTGPRSRTTSRQ